MERRIKSTHIFKVYNRKIDEEVMTNDRLSLMHLKIKILPTCNKDERQTSMPSAGF